MRLEISLEPVSAENKSVLRHLLELCQYDYSEFNGADVNEHGLFAYSYLDNYWTEPGRFAFFIRVNQKLAGLAMVRRLEKTEQGDLYSLAEYCVLRKYRRQGVGKEAAFRIFDQFPGLWSVEQEEHNTPAQVFWRKIIGEYTQGSYQEGVIDLEGEQRPNQRFVSRRMTG